MRSMSAPKDRGRADWRRDPCPGDCLDAEEAFDRPGSPPEFRRRQPRRRPSPESSSLRGWTRFPRFSWGEAKPPCGLQPGPRLPRWSGCRAARARRPAAEKRTSRLGRMAKRGVVEVHDRLGHHGDDRMLQSPASQLVGERLDEHVPDGALRVGDRVVHRNRVHFFLRVRTPASIEQAVRFRARPPAASLARPGRPSARPCARRSRTAAGWSRALRPSREAVRRRRPLRYGSRDALASPSLPGVPCRFLARDASLVEALLGRSPMPAFQVCSLLQLSCADAGVDDRLHSGIDDEPRVNARRRAAEVEGQQRERAGWCTKVIESMQRLFAVGIRWSAADELHDGGRALPSRSRPWPLVSVMARVAKVGAPRPSTE